MMVAPFRACSVDGCNSNAARIADGRRGFCRVHYWRLKRHGDPFGGGMVRPFLGELTAKRLQELLQYDPLTGILTWLVNRQGAKAGDVAGVADGRGYLKVSIGGRSYKAHRLAVLYMTGEWPKEQVDHVDRNKANNRWVNLREATHGQNMCNASRRADNASGVPGVSWHRGAAKWQVHIVHGGVNHNLGLFVRFEDAVAVRKSAEPIVFGEFAPMQLET